MKQIESERLLKIGQRLYECRKAKRWSQAYVAEKIDVSINTMSSIENGLQQLNLANLLRLSELYGTSTDYILYGKTQEYYNNQLFHTILKIPPIERVRVLRAIEAFYEIEE